MTGTSIRRGLALAILLAATGAATAQGPRDFNKKPFDGGRGAPSDVDRLRGEMKALEGQIERLRGQIAELNRAAERGAPSDKGKFEPKGRPDFKGGPPPWAGQWKKPMDKKDGPPAAKDGKGAPPWAEMWKKAMEDKMKQAKDGKGGPPWAEMWKKAMEDKMKQAKDGRGAPPAGPKGPPQWAGRGPGGPPRGPAAGPSADLESRVNRLERAVEEIRREMRSSRSRR